MRTKEEIQNHIDECNSIINNLYEKIKYYEEFIKEDETDILELEQVEYQDHIIEDDILPLQAMYYSINKLK